MGNGRLAWLRLAAGLMLMVTLVGLAAGCRRGPATGASITLAGSTSVQPFAELLAEEYMAKGKPSINVQGGGSSAGIQAAETGAAQIGMSSRELKPDEQAQLVETVIAQDAIAVVVHPSNPVGALSLEQTRQIFSGQVTNWRAVGGPDKPIHAVTREEGSGTRGAFQELVMGKSDINPGSIVQDSNGAVRQVVADDPNAIGYISLGLVNEQVKPVSVGKVPPTHENVVDGSYALKRPFLFVQKGPQSAAAESFIKYTLSPEGQQLLVSEGLVPAKK